MVRKSWIVLAGACLAAGVYVSAQERGGEDLTGPYDVVENWMKPLPAHKEWTCRPHCRRVCRDAEPDFRALGR